MAINKVVYNNETLIDISSDTVTADKLGYGITAHDSSGQRITGTVNMSGATNIPTKVSDLDNDAGFIQNGTIDDVSFAGNIAVPATGLLKVVEVTLASNASIGAPNGTLDGTVAVNAPSGFTPVAAVGFSISGTRYAYFFKLVLSGSSVEYSLRNTNSSAVTVTVLAQVLCVRTSL